MAVLGSGSGGKPVSGPITEMKSHPDVRPPEISTSSLTTPVYGTEPPTWNDCIQYPRALELGRPIWRSPPVFPPVDWYDNDAPVPHASGVQFPLKSMALFTVPPDW